MSFRAGDIVRHKRTGQEVVVVGGPGDREYDKQGFAVPDEGFETEDSWEYQKDWELVSKKNGRGRPPKERKVKFLLKYELDEDPVEEFETMKQVKKRIKELLKDETLQRDSMVIYELKSKHKVTIEDAVKIKKV